MPPEISHCYGGETERGVTLGTDQWYCMQGSYPPPPRFCGAENDVCQLCLAVCVNSVYQLNMVSGVRVLVRETYPNFNPFYLQQLK